MITIQTRSYDLPSPTELSFFRDEGHFARKVRDHFLNPEEPWSRLLGVHFLRQVGQKLGSGEVSVLEEAYERAVPLLDGGIRFAAGLPLFVRYEAESADGEGKMSRQKGYFLLAEPGYKVVAHGGVVRTAYFVAKTPGDSYYTLFRQAWRAIKTRALTRQYIDQKGGRTIRHLRVEWFSTETWTLCPNPHQKPRAPVRPVRVLSPEVEYWLQQVTDSVSGEG